MSSPPHIYRSPHPDITLPPLSLTDYVLGSARAKPENVALVDAITGRAITYRELREQVRRAAAGLAALGIRKGDVVALCAPNSPEFGVAFHAIARLGAIVTPANPANTAHELAHQIEDARARLFITTGALADKVRAAIAETKRDIGVITLDEAPGPGLQSLASISLDADPPAVSIDPANDVVVLPYSSGTTGLPKGVMLTHHNILANLLQAAACERTDLRAFIAVLPFFHIYGMTVILNFGLASGLTLVTLPRFELEAFLKALQDYPVELAHIVPPIAVALAKHPAVAGYKFPHLRTVFSGAAPLSDVVENALRQRLNIDVRQGYGMTETSPVAYYADCHSPPRPGTVGQLAPSTECRIVDVESGRDAAVGAPGEVWLRGPQNMKGYLNNPEATARTIDRDGWLRTGDIGTIDADGYLTIVDRLKELIKCKGFQVAPAELEALLLKHPRIADAAVIPVADEECGQVPKALVVAREGLTAQDVFTFVHDQVSHYKRLRYVELVETIPKSPSGKILRRLLVDRENQSAAISSTRNS